MEIVLHSIVPYKIGKRFLYDENTEKLLLKDSRDIRVLHKYLTI